MTVDLFANGDFIGCCSYDSEAGIWETSADVKEKIMNEIERQLDRGVAGGTVRDISFSYRAHAPKGEWQFERSSGYDGYRCQECCTWKHENQLRTCDCDN